MQNSRRNFLKWGGLLASGALLPPPPPEEGPRQPTGLARAVRGLYIYEKPSFQSRQLNFLAGDSVVSLFGQAESTDDTPNKIWYRVRRGFIHSAPVQLVSWQFNPISTDVPEGGFLAEVTVPFTQARVGPGPGFRSGYKFYHSTTHWVLDTTEDSDGRVWYGILGDRTKAFTWARGEHLRRITAADIAPISPEVTDKRIEVSLHDQTFKAYENGKLVLDTVCSTGVPLRKEGDRTVWGTPVGEWQVISKRPSRHMAGDDGAADDFFDLPGVPWVTYFHWWGTAVHGTYWHTDYGRPRSHGCINLPSHFAQWVYRWTTPDVPLDKPYVDAKGTKLVVDY